MSTLMRRQQTPEPAMYTQVASQSNKPIYIPPPRQYLSRPTNESTVETPLIGCDNKVIGLHEYFYFGFLRCYGASGVTGFFQPFFHTFS